MKYLFMLGAGFMQKPAIITARELGCRVIAADGNKDAYCVSLCDEFVQIDLKNTDALCRYALSLKKDGKIHAVFTAGTDFSAACAKIAELCGLPSHTYEASLNASDKIRMRSCFEKAGVSSPKFIEIHEHDLMTLQTASILDKFNSTKNNPFPLVIKPVDNMGARGCRMARNETEFKDAVKTAVQYSRSKRAIVEEYMEGPEFSIDSLVYNGIITITGFADRHIYYEPYFIEMGHTMPTALSSEQKEQIVKEFSKGVNALGLSCGAAKGDIKLTKEGAKIGEIAARLSGGYMSGWTYPYASSINLTEQALRISLGLPPSVLLQGKSLEPSSVSAERAWISIPGIVDKIYGFDNVLKITHIKDIFPRAKEGDAVAFPVNNVEKCGNIISCAETRSEAVQSAQIACASIILRLRPDQRETQLFLEDSIHAEFPPSAYKISKKQFEELIFSSKGKISVKEILEKGNTILPSWLSCEDQCDWNHKTACSALDQFCTIAKEDKNLSSRSADEAKFWQYFIRGGLQGIFYLFDGETENE